MARERGVCRDAVWEREPLKGGEVRASGDRSDRAMAAGKRNGAVFIGKRSAQRPEGAEATGIVTRRAKTAKRASWSRAGRSRARRNRARRPVRRTGRAPVLSCRISRRYRVANDPTWGQLTCPKDRGVAEQCCKRSLVGGVRCDAGGRERRGRCRWWRAKRGGARRGGGDRCASGARERRGAKRDTRRDAKEKGPTLGDAEGGPCWAVRKGGGLCRAGVRGKAGGRGAPRIRRRRRRRCRAGWSRRRSGPLRRRGRRW